MKRTWHTYTHAEATTETKMYASAAAVFLCGIISESAEDTLTGIPLLLVKVAFGAAGTAFLFTFTLFTLKARKLRKASEKTMKEPLHAANEDSVSQPL